MIDQAAPLIFAAIQIAVELVLALPALFFRWLRRPVKRAAVTAAVVFVVVLAVVAVSNLTSPTGPVPMGTTLVLGVLGGVIWATLFFVLA
jgi:hypothetical protein